MLPFLRERLVAITSHHSRFCAHRSLTRDSSGPGSSDGLKAEFDWGKAGGLFLDPRKFDGAAHLGRFIGSRAIGDLCQVAFGVQYFEIRGSGISVGLSYSDLAPTQKRIRKI